MTIRTKIVGDGLPPKTVSKRDIVLTLMEYHQPLFEKEGVNNPKFIPRLCYNNTAGEKVIGFYSKELYGGVDIYIEFCSRDFTPEDPKRTLWKWIFNPDYGTEYPLSEPHPATHDRRYLIPVSELLNVTELHTLVETPVIEPEPVSPEKPVILVPVIEFQDAMYRDMTITDYAAIIWKKPVSSRSWLNELIIKNFKK